MYLCCIPNIINQGVKIIMKGKKVEEAITQALLDLMKIMDYDRISITDITEKAHLSRVTYYRHFNSKEDILKRYFVLCKNKFLSQFSQMNTAVSNEVVILNLFVYFKTNMEVNKTLRTAKLEGVLSDFLSDEFINNLPIKLDKYYAYFIAGALFNVLIHWLDNDCKDPIDEVIRPFVEIPDAMEKAGKIKKDN